MLPPWHCLPALPSIERHGSLSLPLSAQRRQTEVMEREKGMSLNAPLTPQNEIDRLAEVIAPSTIFFGRKYCYRQIGDSISGRRWGWRQWSKGSVCPLWLRLQCLLMFILCALPFFTHILSLFLYPNPTSSTCCIFPLFTSTYPPNTSLSTFSFLFSRVFSSVDHFFASLKGKTLSPSTQKI